MGNRTPGSRDATGCGPNRLRLAVAQAKYCNSFQLTHMPRGNHDREQWRPKVRQDIITALTT